MTPIRSRGSWFSLVCRCTALIILAFSCIDESETAESHGKHTLLVVGETNEGNLSQQDPLYEDKGPSQTFHLVANETGMIRVCLVSKYFDADLVIRDDRGEIIAEDDDSGPGDGAEVHFTAAAKARYTVTALSAEKDGVGRFILKAAVNGVSKTEGEKLVEDRQWYEKVVEEKDLSVKRRIKVLNNLGACRFLMGSAAEAKEPWERALDLCREAKDRRMEGNVLGNLGAVYSHLGQMAKAIECHEKALIIHQETSDRSGEGHALINLGNAYWRLSQPGKAIDYYQQALALHREAKNRRGEGTVLGNLGGAYSDLGQVDKAIEYYERALAIHRETKNRRGEGRVLGNLGLAYSELGQVDKAIEYEERALAIHRETKDRRSEGIVLGNLGRTYSGLCQAKKAIEYYEEALAIHRQTGDRGGEGFALGSLGNAYADLGQVKKAIEYYEQALATHRQTGERRGEGSVLGYLGNAYCHLGQVGKAVEYYDRALAIHEQTGNRYGEGNLLQNFGLLYSRLGQKEKAIEYFERALAISQSSKYLRGEGAALQNLGHAYSYLGQRKKAIKYYEQALAIHRETHDRRGEGPVLVGLGRTYRNIGQFDKSIQYYEQALTIHRETHNRRGEGITLVHLGEAYSELGEAETALDYCVQSLAILRETEDQSIQRLILEAEGRVEAKRGQHDRALEAFRSAQAIDTSMLERVEVTLETSAFRSFAELAAERGFSDFFRLLLRLRENAKSQTEGRQYLLEAFNLTEGWRTRALANSMRAREARTILSPEGKLTWDRIVALTRKLSDLTVTTRSEDRRQAIRTHEREIESLERELKRTEPKYAELCATPEKTDLGDLAGLFMKGELLLYYTFAGDQVAVFHWRPGGELGIQVLDVSATELVSAVTDALEGIRQRERIEDLKGRLGSLRKHLFFGLEGKTREAQGLVIIPDGMLHLLPFEALVFENGRYLVERFRIRYAPSLKVLAGLRKPQETTARYDLVLYGNPEYGGGVDVARAVRVRRGKQWSQLEHAAKEVAKVAPLFQRRIVRSGPEASERRFKREAGSGAVLHVVTHGEYAGEKQGADPLFYSTLAFSGCNTGGDGEEDGVLTAGEVLGLDLGCVKLVTLSACETAAGQFFGHEGKFSMERAFFAAGARGYVGSLWSVHDAASGEFMARFYRSYTAGITPEEAIRDVKMQFLREGPSLISGEEGGEPRERAGQSREGPPLAPRATDLSHPYYWAPFVFSGEGGHQHQAESSAVKPNATWRGIVWASASPFFGTGGRRAHKHHGAQADPRVGGVAVLTHEPEAD